MAGPRIEDLDQLGAILDLVQGVVADAVRKVLQNRVKKLRLVESHLLYLEVFLGSLSFNHVRGQCVRASDESEDRCFGTDLLSKDLKSFGNERSSRRGIDRVDLFGVVPGLDGIHDWSEFVVDREFASDTGKGSQNIGKQDAPIGLVISPRLKGDLYGDFGDFTSLTECGPFFAQISVFFDVSSRLSHHPDGGSFDLFTLCGTDQEWILCGLVGVLLRCRNGLVDGALDDCAR
mmetsp:Transcript_3546/g.9374  ORF Transcript_3546/g.9374 Transcript_3546/m.9374 type:complete len:233 (-) Transcript_3546:202-900(-)